MALFEISGIDDFVDTANLVAKTYPKEVKKFMQSEGTKLKNRTVKTAKSTVGEKTGNYLIGIKRGKLYKYSGNGADSIRVYSGRPAYHGHLVEYGHEMVTHSGERTGKYVLGHLVFKNSADAFESTYEGDCERFADKITSPLER